MEMELAQVKESKKTTTTFEDIAFVQSWQEKYQSRLKLIRLQSSPVFRSIFEQYYGSINKDEVTKIDESVDSAANSILGCIEETKSKIVLISSVGDKTGQSQFVLELQKNLHKKSDLRILAIDGHFYSAGFTRFTRFQKTGFGALDLLAGDSPIWSCIVQRKDYSFLERGRSCNDRESIVQENRVAEMCVLLREFFDIILVDSPSMKASNDLFGWASEGDAAILLYANKENDLVNSDVIEKELEGFGIDVLGYSYAPFSMTIPRME